MLNLALFMFAAALSTEATAPEASAPQAAPTEAPKSSDQATPSDAQAAPKKPKRICRPIPSTGSRAGGEKICKTAEQWKKAN